MNHDLSDNDIFQSIMDDSEEAFGTLFRRYYPRLHRFACKYIAEKPPQAMLCRRASCDCGSIAQRL